MWGCCELAVHVVETIAGAGWVLGIPALGAGAGHRELACRCSVLVPASDCEVVTTAASDSEG